MKRCCDMDGVNRFSGRAAIYARGRPSYPREAIDFVRGDAKVILDAGAGTGISTALLEHAFGIDPNVEMLRASEGSSMVAGRAEALPFRTALADLLTAFNSFHWFQPAGFFDEAHRVLRPSGRLALVWNDWNLDDAFTAAFVRIMRSRAGDMPPEDRAVEVAPLFGTDRFGDVEHRAFENVHALDLEHLRLRMQSMTYIPKEGPAWDEIDRELTALHRQHADGGGVVRHRYVTNAYVARRRA